MQIYGVKTTHDGEESMVLAFYRTKEKADAARDATAAEWNNNSEECDHVRWDVKYQCWHNEGPDTKKATFAVETVEAHLAE